ncbi:MAG: response regulator transcription factor [Oceanospirillaceae bacterium]|nr:response regulator transcription factor [Oceanospirillaceae bacterium]
MNLLVIEDDIYIQNFLQQGFEQEGYRVTVAGDGEEGTLYATTEHYDLIILDLMLPKVDGMQVLRSIRGQGFQTPIIILSAKHAVEEKILGLQSGADDYLSKPFAFSELLARCQSLSRRQQANLQQTNVLQYQDLHLDLLKRIVKRGSIEITLNQREYALMELFLRHREKVCSKTVILEKVWGFQFDPQTNVVDVLVCRLRSKIDRGFASPLIHTIRGVGYVLKHES